MLCGIMSCGAMMYQTEPLEDQLVVFDDFLTNRVAQWHCTLCGRRPTVRAGTWVCIEAGSPSAAAFMVCQACDTAGHPALSQLDRKLRDRYGLPPPPDRCGQPPGPRRSSEPTTGMFGMDAVCRSGLKG